jgi:pimeloyl-ACP methyl ester carboxylesterase
MSALVLVHGGMHGPWCWEQILPLLRDAGHEVHPVALPGRDQTDVTDLSLDAYADVVADAVLAAGPPAVLVAHSLGGVVASRCAERTPGSVAKIVFVNALLVEDGETPLAKLAAAGAESALLAEGALDLETDPSAASLAPETARAAFFNRCDQRDADWAVARLCPEPIAPLTAPVTLSATGFGSVPKSYLGAHDDRVLPWRFQQQMSAACGAALTALGGDHSPFLSAVDELVDRLLLEATV